MLKLTPENLAAAYDYLCETRPFIRWNLPPSEDVCFQVIRDKTLYGWYDLREGRHIIAVSKNNVGHTHTLMRVLAHEMLHLHLRQVRVGTTTGHSKAFHKFAAIIAREHGFDPMEL